MRLSIAFGLIGAGIGFVVGARFTGADCTYPSLATAREDSLRILGQLPQVVEHIQRSVSSIELPTLQPRGLLSMPTDFSHWLDWILPALLAAAALGWWWWTRHHKESEPRSSAALEPPPVVDAPAAVPPSDRGRELKTAVGSAGIKSIVREGRVEDAYQVRAASETAFEAFADFDTQQERVALNNRLPGPPFLTLSDTLDAHSPLAEGMGNRPPRDVWALREEWMPPLSEFVAAAAFRLVRRVSGRHASRSISAPRATDCSACTRCFEVPKNFRERIGTPTSSSRRAMSSGMKRSIFWTPFVRLRSDTGPWRLTCPGGKSAAGADCPAARQRARTHGPDEVAAHIAPALTARVRFETATSENLSNLLRDSPRMGCTTG